MIFKKANHTKSNASRQKEIAIEGNGCRPSHMGDGYSDRGIMYTLNATERHAVVFDPDQRHDYKPFDDVCGTVTARYGTGGGQHTNVYR